MATRHQVRQCVVSLLYAKEMGSQMEQFSDEFLEEKKIRNDQKNFTISLYNGVLDNLDNIDNLLNSYLGKWKLEQIGIVERQILRLGAYEMKMLGAKCRVIFQLFPPRGLIHLSSALIFLSNDASFYIIKARHAFHPSII